MEPTLLLILAGLVLLGYLIWTAVREAGRLGAGGTVESLRFEERRQVVLAEQDALQMSLAELEIGRELGRVEAQDGQELAEALHRPLAELDGELEHVEQRTQLRRVVEAELSQRLRGRVGAASQSPAAAAPAARSGIGKGRGRERRGEVPGATAVVTGDAAAGVAGHCTGCGRPFKDGDRFCQGCGLALGHSCPGCGAELAADARFCKRCGHRVA